MSNIIPLWSGDKKTTIWQEFQNATYGSFMVREGVFAPILPASWQVTEMRFLRKQIKTLKIKKSGTKDRTGFFLLDNSLIT
jgi:hypothetical protein